MNILIIGNEDFACILGDKLKLSHHYTQHFFAAPNILNNQSESFVNIDFDDENDIVNFCVNQKIDVVVLSNEQVLNNGFYDKLKANSFMDRIIIVGAAQETIQESSLSALVQKEITSNSVNTEQIVILTDGKNYKMLNEKNEFELNLIEQLISENLKKRDLKISGFICLQLSKIDNFYELSSFQFMMNNEVATTIFERLETDVLSLFAAMDNGTLEDVNIEFYDKK
ncbi:MAG: hypothetical protein KGZ59_02190 [Chitinophagaceae bacterium]|nr:hypothetical protein [Chitinophagaceae bacterium]